MGRYKRIIISDFGFKFKGYGHYEVTYDSFDYSYLVKNEETKECENPKVKDLERLKRLCKS